ncbi:VOC family protein [Flavobacterium sp. TBRC 19031]|jgi:uncharacterized glyoxalase superfamily protein PhnB|uniref:VOC family protein n=1 Tax=Flavobacterium mekongense TaxID=3379707 RepID=UPI00399B45E1
MNFQPIIPIIWTEELQETVDFYCNILDFTCGNISEEWQWASLFKDDCELMIAKPNKHTSFDKPSFTGTFYIKVDDVELLWKQLKNNVKIVYELETFDWGMKEFAIYDNNGYTIQFGQDIT